MKPSCYISLYFEFQIDTWNYKPILRILKRCKCLKLYQIVTDYGSNGIVKPNQLSPYKDVGRLSFKSCDVLNTIHITTNLGVVSNTKYS